MSADHELPVFDLAELHADDDEVIERLVRCCCDVGFFYLTGAGVSDTWLADATTAARGFFALPAEVKGRYGHDVQTVVPRGARGYVPPFGETLYPESGGDLKECFDLGIESLSVRPARPFAGSTVMPAEHIAPGFSEHLFGLQNHVMSAVVPRLVQCFARALGWASTALDSAFEPPTLCQRVLYYPSTGGSAGKHTDNGFFTVLFIAPDDRAALRIHSPKHGGWIDVQGRPGACLINLGDMLQVMSGGSFTSTPHEVQLRRDDDRVSFAFFVYPDIDTPVSALGPAVADDPGAPLVRDIMLANFESIWVTKQGAGRASELS